MNGSISSDSDKIDQLVRLLEQTDLYSTTAAGEIVLLAASINDREDRDLGLFKVTMALAAAGQWSIAEEAAEAINNDFEKSEAFYALARQSASNNQLSRCLDLLSHAIQVANEVSEPWQQAELLSRIAQVLSIANRHDQARELWDRAILVAREGEGSNDLQGSVDSSSVLREIAEKLALAGLVDKATEVARSIKSPGKRDGALSAVQKISQPLGSQD